MQHSIIFCLQHLLPNIHEQSDFRHKHSPKHRQLSVIECIDGGLDNYEHIGSLFTYVSKAFDTVWISGLIHKLLKLKVPTAHTRFVLKYLRGRTFCFRYEINFSPLLHLYYGYFLTRLELGYFL